MSSAWWRVKALQAVPENRRLTQAALAEKVGVSRVTIAHLESGKRQPSMALLQRLAKALKVKLPDLLR